MKTKLLFALALILAGCAPTAMVTEQSGSEFLMEKVEPVGEPLQFRTTSGTTSINLSELAELTVDPSEVVTHGGESWIQATIGYMIEESITSYNGWIKLNSQFSGVCPGGDCELDVVKLQYLDFVMAEVLPVIDSTTVPTEAPVIETPAAE